MGDFGCGNFDLLNCNCGPFPTRFFLPRASLMPTARDIFLGDANQKHGAWGRILRTLDRATDSVFDRGAKKRRPDQAGPSAEARPPADDHFRADHAEGHPQRTSDGLDTDHTGHSRNVSLAGESGGHTPTGGDDQHVSW
eukprot:NODE_2407_length_611_cov_192.023132_g2047_i0.p1 GENE.NODE_2407_length_611_cov_192.023132_g2047_i0~~NODE_2407_length_611_cov_192.023132_g2047_i0.p1  ORF type:complete len:146 (-),score=25.48 NODE_2407_length_611_cov_192.023132_g2047_i0:173-589(-)